MTDPPDQQRANYVPAPHFYNLNQACAILTRAFPEGGVYLVGSSLRRRDFRDVDVRLMLKDETFDRLFPAGISWLDARWSLECTSISLWLAQQSGLPIDFQIQKQSRANADHPGKERQALGLFLSYPGERPSEAASGAFLFVENDVWKVRFANGQIVDVPPAASKGIEP